MANRRTDGDDREVEATRHTGGATTFILGVVVLALGVIIYVVFSETAEHVGDVGEASADATSEGGD